MSGCRSLQEESELLPAAGHLDVVGHGCNLSVRVYPQGTGGLNPETGGVVSVHPFEQVVLSEEGCGKHQQYLKFRNIAHCTQIQNAIL